METEHEVFVGDSRSLDAVADESVQLVVTSPPYPMIEMWDESFAELNPEIGARLDEGDGDAAFELMHRELGAVWAEVRRVLEPGGIACVNVGDATRKIGGSFRLFPNHASVIESFTDAGFQALPDILWRKPSNRATKFMGSGMVPPNAYASLEHEYVLVFRKGETRRSFEPGADRRYNSAYFWEERNDWFSDVWTDLRGTDQTLGGEEPRERSAAFPLELPSRLVNMYSVYGDTVLDPFWGTGTTTTAAMLCGRNSVGSELRPAFVDAFAERVDAVPELSRKRNERRIERHRRYVAESDRQFEYDATHYDVPVMTKQERDLLFYSVTDVRRTNEGYVVDHAPFDAASAASPEATE